MKYQMLCSNSQLFSLFSGLYSGQCSMPHSLSLGYPFSAYPLVNVYSFLKALLMCVFASPRSFSQASQNSVCTSLVSTYPSVS